MGAVKTRGSVDKLDNNLSNNKTFTELWLESKNAFSKRDAVNQFEGLVEQYEIDNVVLTNRLPSSVLNRLENLANDEERIAMLERILLDNGFDVEIHYSSQNNITVFYTKENIDTVYCVLLDWEEVKMTIIDKDVFLEMARDSEDKAKTFSLTVSKSTNEIHTYSSGKPCPVYHLAFHTSKYAKNIGVDHITRHVGINIREYLRVCSNAENNLNKRPVLRVSADDVLKFEKDKDGYYFSVSKGRVSKSDIQTLKNGGYKLEATRIISPKLESEDELSKEVNKVIAMINTKVLIDFATKLVNMKKSQFNYNPLLDFEDTWYALVLHKLFPNNISRQDVENYNRAYFRKNHQEIAEVYNL